MEYPNEDSTRFYLYWNGKLQSWRVVTLEHLQEKGAAGNSEIWLVDLDQWSLQLMELEDLTEVNYRVHPAGSGPVGGAVSGAGVGSGAVSVGLSGAGSVLLNGDETLPPSPFVETDA